jgi:hypothetical protein
MIMKKKILYSLGLLALTATVASAQTAAGTSTVPPAVNTGKTDSTTAAAPVAGKNSFTESQAHARLAKQGYTDISALKQDDKSIWRGTATKDGKSGNVAVDYQGNVVSQ